MPNSALDRKTSGGLSPSERREHAARHERRRQERIEQIARQRREERERRKRTAARPPRVA